MSAVYYCLVRYVITNSCNNLNRYIPSTSSEWNWKKSEIECKFTFVSVLLQLNGRSPGPPGSFTLIIMARGQARCSTGILQAIRQCYYYLTSKQTKQENFSNFKWNHRTPPLSHRRTITKCIVYCIMQYLVFKIKNMCRIDKKLQFSQPFHQHYIINGCFSGANVLVCKIRLTQTGIFFCFVL